MINLVLGLILCVALMLFSRQWYADWKLVQQRVIPTETISHHEDDNQKLIASLPNTHLFGKPISPGSVPLSSLQFKVSGIVKTEISKDSKVYISLAGGGSKIFHVGDKLPYGVKVYEITPDAVILENDGHLEKLTLTRDKLQFKTRTSLEHADA